MPLRYQTPINGIPLCLYQSIIIIKVKKGKVKFFNDSKGFGFITDSESNQEYFVHVSGLLNAISENDEVTFDLQEGRKGLNAANVRLA